MKLVSAVTNYKWGAASSEGSMPPAPPLWFIFLSVGLTTKPSAVLQLYLSLSRLASSLSPSWVQCRPHHRRRERRSLRKSPKFRQIVAYELNRTRSPNLNAENSNWLLGDYYIGYGREHFEPSQTMNIVKRNRISIGITNPCSKSDPCPKSRSVAIRSKPHNWPCLSSTMAPEPPCLQK